MVVILLTGKWHKISIYLKKQMIFRLSVHGTSFGRQYELNNIHSLTVGKINKSH